MAEKPDSATIRALAVEAGVHPTTIRKVLEGRPVRGMAGHRARCTLTINGWLKPMSGEKAPQP